MPRFPPRPRQISLLSFSHISFPYLLNRASERETVLPAVLEWFLSFLYSHMFSCLLVEMGRIIKIISSKMTNKACIHLDTVSCSCVGDTCHKIMRRPMGFSKATMAWRKEDDFLQFCTMVHALTKQHYFSVSYLFLFVH